MKLRIHEIKKATCKMLSGYFGFGVEGVDPKNDRKTGATNLQTPDFYNGRVNNFNRKNSSTTRRPG